MPRFGLLTALAVLACVWGESACLFRTRPVEMRTSTAKLETATKQQLVSYLQTEAAKIKTLNATVDIAASVGGEKKGKVTQYEEIRGYILVRKPNTLRMIGLFPIVRNKAFDMVSDGDQFKLSIPAKNKFYIGHNNIVHPGGNTLESLRPQVIYSALLLPDMDPDNDIAVLEDSKEDIYDAKKKRILEQPNYVIDVIHHAGGDWYLARKVVFDRTNLTVHEQIIYNPDGAISTEATYQVYQDYNGVSFPSVIEIKRPQEEYSIRLTVDKLTVNETLRDDQFALQQPPGSLLIDLDQPNQSAASGAGTPAAPPQSNPPKP
jgi:outer membrane lipoprotein-sorting protein